MHRANCSLQVYPIAMRSVMPLSVCLAGAMLLSFVITESDLVPSNYNRIIIIFIECLLSVKHFMYLISFYPYNNPRR